MVTLYAHRCLFLAGLLACALSAGFFYTYSISVMPGLAAADPLSAIRAMQGINAVIRTPVFAFAFFGALLFPVAAALVSWLLRKRAEGVFAAISAAVYAVGVIGVTFVVNVPLNEALAAATPTAETAGNIWSAYQIPWTAWNHVRAVAAILAFAIFTAAIVLHFCSASWQLGRELIHPPLK